LLLNASADSNAVTRSLSSTCINSSHKKYSPSMAENLLSKTEDLQTAGNHPPQFSLLDLVLVAAEKAKSGLEHSSAPLSLSSMSNLTSDETELDDDPESEDRLAKSAGWHVWVKVASLLVKMGKFHIGSMLQSQ
jgi:hypothetical protein